MAADTQGTGDPDKANKKSFMVSNLAGNEEELETSTATEEEEDDDDEEEEEEDEEDEDEGEDDEPKLKHARLTSNLGPVYRNGDATSTFLVAGDKMVWNTCAGSFNKW